MARFGGPARALLGADHRVFGPIPGPPPIRGKWHRRGPEPRRSGWFNSRDIASGDGTFIIRGGPGGQLLGPTGGSAFGATNEGGVEGGQLLRPRMRGVPLGGWGVVLRSQERTRHLGPRRSAGEISGRRMACPFPPV
jgi:hypothetical protein